MLTIIRNILLGLSLAASPGPVNVEVIKRGLKHGFLPAFLLSLGALTADLTYLIIIYLGLYNFINVPVVNIVITLFGAVVLLYLGYSSIKDFFGKIDLKKSNPRAGKNSFIAGYLITISSPVTMVWWFGVFGVILGSSVQVSAKALAFINSLFIMVGGLLWFFTLSLLLNYGKNIVKEKTIRYLSLVAGFLLVGFGLYFGYINVISII